jgi:hypothetical protein
MLMVSSEPGLGGMLDALSRLHGYRSDVALAHAMTEAGYSVSQQAISNYRRGEKIPPAGFIVCFIEILDIEGEQRRSLLDAWLELNRDIGELYKLIGKLL